jgi:hypothetical protein
VSLCVNSVPRAYQILINKCTKAFYPCFFFFFEPGNWEVFADVIT